MKRKDYWILEDPQGGFLSWFYVGTRKREAEEAARGAARMMRHGTVYLFRLPEDFEMAEDENERMVPLLLPKKCAEDARAWRADLPFEDGKPCEVVVTAEAVLRDFDVYFA